MSRLPMKIAYAAIAVALAGTSLIASAGNILRARSPQVAAMLPGETQARVALLNRMQDAGKRLPPKAAAATARDALRSNPLDSPALRLLMDAAPDAALSLDKLRLAKLAGRVSKRDGRIRLVLFEDAARHNRSEQVLQNLDALLRVTPESQTKVFPMLKGVLPSEDFRAHLSPYLVKRAPWMLDFVLYAANDAQAVGNMADVVIRSGKSVDPRDAAYIVPHLISRTIEAGEYAKVRPLVSMITKSPDDLLAVGRWNDDSTASKYGLAAWQAASDATTSASFMNRNEAGYRPLSVYASSGANGVAASKFLLLKPGSYELVQKIRVAEIARAPSAEWQLRCVSSANKEAIWTSGNFLSPDGRKLKYLFNVPADCPQQLLLLNVAVDFEAPPVELTIDEFRLGRAPAGTGPTPVRKPDSAAL